MPDGDHQLPNLEPAGVAQAGVGETGPGGAQHGEVGVGILPNQLGLE